MKKQLLVLSIFLLTATAFAANNLPAPKSSLQPIDQVAAVVNDQVIVQSEVDKMYEHAIQQIEKTNAQMPSESTLKNEILNQMIYQKLQLQLVKRNNIKVTDAQVTATIKKIAKQHKISVTALKRKLLEQGSTYSKFRTEMKKQIQINILQHHALAKDIKVSDAEINKFLNKYKTQKKYATQYHIIDVLVPLPAAPTSTQEKQARVEALKIIKSLRKGGDILKIKGATVTDLGLRMTTSLPDLFVNKLKKMKVGDLAGPLRAQNGYHIIQLIAIKKGSAQLPRRSEIRNILMNQKFQKAVHTWVTSLRKQSYVKIVNPQ